MHNFYIKNILISPCIVFYFRKKYKFYTFWAKKTPILVGVKMCKNVYIFSWATVTVYIYTVTVTRLSIKIILSLYSIKTSFLLFFSLSSHWAHQCLLGLNFSLPVSSLSSSSHLLSLFASYQLLLILIATGNNNVNGLGVSQPRKEGGSIDRLIFSIDKLWG